MPKSSSNTTAYNMPNLFSISVTDSKPFQNHQVAVLGRTANMSNKEISSFFENLGAIVSNVPSKNVSLLFVLRDLTEKDKSLLENLEFNGYELNILGEEDLNLIKNGTYCPYKSMTCPSKDLKLSKKHLQRLWYTIEGSENYNPLYHRTLFFPPNLKFHKDAIGQVLGNLGMMISDVIDEDTDIIVLTDESVMNITEGNIDNDITYIQDAYNKSSQITFAWKFFNINNLLLFIEEKIKETNDEITNECFIKYKTLVGQR